MIKSVIQSPTNIVASFCHSLATPSNHSHLNFLDKYDSQQVALLDEPLIVVDKEDRIIGQTTKKDAHLLSYIEREPSLIHRAFSFFLFDTSTVPSRLVLQQRSAQKITYPNLWANTCCSHPLYNEIEINGIHGIKHAVKRRLQIELGYEFNSDVFYLARIFYQARNIPDDGIFGESEIDYIIIGKYKEKTPIDFKINTNEVKQIGLFTLKECEELVRQNATTPWFTRIVREGLLTEWWLTVDNTKLNNDIIKSDDIIQL